MTKKLDERIKNAFTTLGFSDEEIAKGCWLLEKPKFKGSDEMVGICWIALHKFLERVAEKAGITFEKPELFNVCETEVAMWVQGSMNGKTAWSVGEASIKNCKNEYRWAMAEKRAKDRVILKLIGVAGDMYSEEESDEFKKDINTFQKEVSLEKAKETRERNKIIKDIKNNPDELKKSARHCVEFLNNFKEITSHNEAVIKRTTDLIDRLEKAGLEIERDMVRDVFNSKLVKQDLTDIETELPDDLEI